MRWPAGSAALAAAFVLVPVAVGDAPAWCQDFSITNKIEPVDAGRRDVMRQLQAWWDVHAYYPKAASQNDEGGTVKLHLVIHPDGNIWTADVTEGSGSGALDRAGAMAFHGGFIRPLPVDPTGPDTQIDIAVHYVLAHRHDQPVAAAAMPASPTSRFTISNDPVGSAVVDTLLRRTCTGFVVRDGLRNHPLYGSRHAATAVFFRKPDGSPWVMFQEGGFGVAAPVTETGKVAQWTGREEWTGFQRGGSRYARYTVWPDGENRLSGDMSDPRGTVELTCTTEMVPAITANAMLESKSPSWPQAELRE